MPYAPIANPIPDSGIDQRVRDSSTMKPSRIRLNQAGYRTVDVTEGMAKFYYVGTGLAFKVIDSATKATVGTGNLTAKGFSSGTKMSVRASTWAGTVAGGDTRYLMSTDGLGTTIPSTGVMEGTLPTTGLVEGGRYRIAVGTDTSHTFLVSKNIYGMVRDGVLKFFGANRSGAGPSWFHAPSHTKDGTLAVPSAPGAYQGGWYDCGDHLKEPQTMGYALAALATITATMPDRDADDYGANHANTLRTDGIPDMLNEAKFGADFFLRSWVRNGRSTGAGTGMITGVGDFGKDHGWWGRPENQDAMTETGRGGVRERTLRSELGSNTLGDVAAGLAILSKRWRPYNAKWADTALMAAKEMYAYAKANPGVVSSPAYNGATDYTSNMALAATALLWATRDRQYLHDIAYNTTIGSKGHYDNGTGVPLLSKESWEGGWMVVNNPNLRKGGANTDWANRHQYALYAFYKLILADKDSALLYGVASEAERQTLAGRTIAGVIQNLNAISGTSQIVIDLPVVDPINGGGYAIRSSSDWFKMHTQQEWVWNRYQMGNSLEMYFYYDITKDFVEGKAGTNLQGKVWNREPIRQLIIRQMDYQLGLNPWDVSMIMGLGEKSFNHPHHRGANPEGRNTPGAAYGYRVPVGALYGAWDPTNATNNAVRDFWGDHFSAEVCLDGAATSVAIAAALADEVPLNLPPKATVKVVYVSDTSAQIEVFLDKFGTMKLDYGAGPLVRTKSVSSDSAGVTFRFLLGGLTPSTQYFFDVTASDLSGNSAKTSKWENPLPDGTPFSFTTKALPVGPANIQNVKVCNVTADSAEIMWYTPDGEHQSSICWGKTPVQDATWTCAENIDVEGHPTKFHYVKIGGLQEKTNYWFKVGSDGVWDDNGGANYTFRTPVRMANFSLYAVQYQWSGMPALGINVINNESRNYDSLSVRVYVRSTDTLKNAMGVPLTHIKSTSTGLVNVPLLFQEAMAARYDICQAYDGAGFNRPCDDPSWGLNWSWSTLNRGVQMLPPTKMPETCDATSNTCVYYFDLPLGPTMMQQGSRIRFDVMFAARSEYSKNITAAQIGLIDWVRDFVPSVPLYAVGDTGWFDALDQPLAAHPMGKETQDWSFMPHSVAGGDPVDFVGIPKVADQTAANALIDNLSDEMPLNPYMTVYRKGEFVYGFSPSYIEQAQKKAYWGADVKFDPPFDLPDGSVIVLDRPTSIVRVKGTADIYDKLTPAAKGVITDIWVNGQRLTASERGAAAVQNPVTKLWALDIPVRMGVGSNNVDVTIFGGAPVCSDTTTNCNAGCAFENGSWFVQFTKGKSTASAIALRDPATSAAIVSDLVSDSSKVMVEVRDNDNNLSRTARDVVRVTLRSGRDSVVVTLTETGDSTGIFLSGGIAISTIPGWTITSVSPKGGDTLVARYLDANDSEDSSSTWLRVKSLWPTPERGGIFRSCGGAYEARVLFDRALPGGASLGAELVANGGFETPAGTTAGIQVNNAGTLGAWTVSDVDLVHSSILPTAAGSQSLDLNNLRQGSISQALSTTAGTTYRISFQYSWNDYATDADPAKEAVVTWNGVAIDTIRPATGARRWLARTLTATAVGGDVLGFKATKGLQFGMMLDEVSVRSTSSASAPGAELLVNGTFESPVVASEFNTYGAATSIPGWTVTNVDLVTTSFQSAFDGTQAMDLNSSASGSIRQTVVAHAGTSLQLSYRWAINAHEQTSPTPKRAVLEWNGVVLDTLNALGTESRVWTAVTHSVISAGSNTVTFRSLLGGNAGIMIDGVSLRSGSASALANPSSVTVVLRNGPGDSTTLVVPGTSTTFDATTKTLSIPLVGVPESGVRTGRASITISDASGATKVVGQALADSVGPWIDSAKIVENLEGRLVDTIAFWASEPIVAPAKTWFFSVTRGGAALPTTTVVVDSAWLSDPSTGRWTMVVRTGIVKAGDFLRLVPTQVRDLKGNAAEDCPSLERELKLWVRQAPVSRAWIRDANGDGTADQVVVVYKRALRASEAPASIRVRFGISDSIRNVVVAPVAGDSVVVIDLPVAYSRAITNGKALDGSGSVTLLKGGDSVLVTMTDSVGPALLSARLQYGDTSSDTLVLSFSEPIASVPGTSWMQILKAAATNLAISGTPLAVDAWTWKVAVDTGSVVPGDSVRPTSAGRFQDANGKSAAALHPWIEVQGDDRPPSKAWYTDVDGDGRVDRVTLVWSRAPRTKPSFVLLWPSTLGGYDTARVASDAWILQADGRSAIVNVGPFDFGVTSSPTTDLGRQVSNGVATSFAIHDSVPPRLLGVRLSYDAGMAPVPADTLKAVFSEPVVIDLSSSGLLRWGVPVSTSIVYHPQALSTDGLTWSIPVDTLTVFPGDSVRPSALVGFSDASGNRPSVLHPWVAVEGAERPPLRAWIQDRDGDGAADQVTVLWSRGPRTSPALGFLWPNGRGGFDSVGIAAGSWILQPDGITAILAVGPFAVGVTSSPTTDLGRQTSAGTITSFPVHDSIAAVMTSARLGYAQNDGQPDTLHLTWSEPVVWTGGEPLAVVRTGLVPRVVRGSQTVMRPDFLGATVLFDPLDSTLTVFRSGDQIRLAPASAGTVSDRFGNVVEDPTRWVPVVLGRRPPRFQITFDPNKLKYKDWVIQPGPALKLYVKSATSQDWTDFETGNVAPGDMLQFQGLGPVISLNQPLRGKAILYDNQGTFVANVDLDLLGEAFYKGTLPMDASNQYQVKIQWNGTASTGKPAASGVYLMRLVLWQNVAGEDEEPEYRVVNQVYRCGWEMTVK